MNEKLIMTALVAVAVTTWGVVLYLTWLMWSIVDALILLTGLITAIIMGIGFSGDSQEKEGRHIHQLQRHYNISLN
jgi:hypothetical protein